MTTAAQSNKINSNIRLVDNANNDRIDSGDRDSRTRHAAFLKWLCKTHGWIGLWEGRHLACFLA